ncbi:hypothetical protein [Dankookia sp. P2]|uniref:hypothetical protein n=1 Tax=Dankookia sp. P2 TaxID=3423955 RepID=UPI003D66DAFC
MPSFASYASAARALSYGPMLDSGGDLARFTLNARPIGREFGGWFVVIGPGPDYGFQAITLPDVPCMPAWLRDPQLDPALARPLAGSSSAGSPRSPISSPGRRSACRCSGRWHRCGGRGG